MIAASVLTVVEHCCVGMHVLHIYWFNLPYQKIYPHVVISPGTHCGSWQYKYTYVDFGNPVPSVMGNQLNIHVHKCWNVKYRRECCGMITLSQVHCLALGQSSWAGSQACSQAATFHFSSALRSSLIFSSFKSSTNCIQACRIQCFRHLQALEHHHQFWLIIFLHTSEWMYPSQRRRNQGTA